jgi:hypothetical protein
MQVEFACAASLTAAVAPVVMKTGTHVAYADATKSVFVADPKVLAVAAVNGSAARTQGPSAGLPAAACGRAASCDAAGNTLAQGGPKKGVMTYGARMVGRKARRAGVAANVTGS